MIFKSIHLIIAISILTLSCKSDKDVKEYKEEKTEEKITPIQAVEEIPLDFVMGRFDPSQHIDFVQIDRKYADKEGLYMQAEAYTAFVAMHEAASKKDIQLVIRSAARNFDYQKGIWERKWTGETKIESGKDASVVYPNPIERAKKILKFSSMPGSSRHHWGTDVDFNNFENSWFETGDGLKLFSWLEANAANFGYCRPYTAKGEQRPFGYEEEKWHWSYIPLAKMYSSMASEALDNDKITGFKGAETAIELNIVQHYVLGINKNCL